MNEKTEFRNAWMIFTKRLIFLQHIVRMASVAAPPGSLS